MPNPITLHGDLPEDEAYAVAQYLKRLCFSDVESHAVDRDEAHLMIAGIEKVREMLAEAGVNPR